MTETPEQPQPDVDADQAADEQTNTVDDTSAAEEATQDATGADE